MKKNVGGDTVAAGVHSTEGHGKGLEIVPAASVFRVQRRSRTLSAMTTPPRPIAVPLLDLRAQYATIRDEIVAAVNEVMDSQQFVLGPAVKELEGAIAAYVGVKHAVGCASGSDAILLALLAHGIGPGDDVICPTYTFFATAGYVARAGASPVFADIDPTTYNVDPESVRDAAKRCRNLKAIMPVHLYGRCADMDAMLEIGREFNVPVIEDAAQAIGSRDATGALAGSRGAIGCFSFFPSKNLGCFGDGGIVVTDDDAIAERLRILRVHGSKPKYHHRVVGVNSRLDSIQAAVLCVKLRYLEEWHSARQRNAAFYDAAFADQPIATPQAPAEPERHIYNQYVIRVGGGLRDGLRSHLAERNIGTEIYYPLPLHLQECFANLGFARGDLPHSEAAADETLALPIYPELTREQLEHVANSVTEFVASHAATAP
jgi:dTDP-4-amino-4,6-dideoxygalactose transaminase